MTCSRFVFVTPAGKASRLVPCLNVCCLRCVSLELGTGVDGIAETDLEHQLRPVFLPVLIGTHMNERACNCYNNPVAVSQDKERQRCNILCMSVSSPAPICFFFFSHSPAPSGAGIPALTVASVSLSLSSFGSRFQRRCYPAPGDGPLRHS